MSDLAQLCILAVLAAGVATTAGVPLWRAWCTRTGLVDEPGGRKIHEHPVPLAGGLAIGTGLLLPLLLLALAWKAGFLGAQRAAQLEEALGAGGNQWAGVLGGAVGMLVLGLIDDQRELGAGPKFAGQMLVAALVAASGVRVTLFVPSVAFSYAVTILWILAVTNAFNFMDNMNGLCAGLGAIASGAIAWNAACADQPAVAALALLVMGSLSGFLPFNFPRALAFLGDAGSHLVGYLLAVLAILPHFYSALNPHRGAVLKPLLILGVPLADMAWVVLLRWRRGQPFYVGDTNHLSHQLVRGGLTKARAVLMLWLAGALLGALSLAF
jgi:UDP-GlcNAc:undecaprenyl-phosphate/decaprenyl-phosphate GlcNAc-1-phosphate transferase